LGESIVGRANGLRARLCQVVHVGAEGWAERTIGGGLWARRAGRRAGRGLGGEEDCTLIGGGLG
jgi:hypothetical protein